MALKLNDFFADIRSQGIQRPNRYQFLMDPPPVMQNAASGLVGLIGDFAEIGRTRQLALRCSAVIFPGITLMTKDDIFRYGYGPVDKTAHGALFNDITVTFIADRDGSIQNFFHKWQRSIVNFDSSGGIIDDYNGAVGYEVEYKDKYVTMIEIDQLNEKNQKTLSLKAQKAFPVNVGDIQLQADANDQALTFQVTFSYRDHKLKTTTTVDSLISQGSNIANQAKSLIGI